jgi:hypothetical protein
LISSQNPTASQKVHQLATKPPTHEPIGNFSDSNHNTKLKKIISIFHNLNLRNEEIKAISTDVRRQKGISRVSMIRNAEKLHGGNKMVD